MVIVKYRGLRFLVLKGYDAQDLVCQIIAGIIDRATGHVHETPITDMVTMYSDLA